MGEKLRTLLKEVGSKLDNPHANKDALIKLLKQAASSLCEMDQSPSKEVLESMQPFINAIVKPELLKHHDKEVKLLVATCTCEITRVTAPDAPYDDDVLKDIFRLIVSTFSGLRDIKSPSFGRRVTILETVAKYRSCIVMLDLGCDDLVNEMFRTFFAVASDEHSETVLTSMKTIMVVLLEESEDINNDLLFVILSVLGRDKKAITMAARRLAMNVMAQCAGKLEPGIKQFILKSMSGEGNSVISQIDYHEIIYNIYRSAPQALVGIVPYITGELLTDKIDMRLKVVKLVGDLFCLPESTIPETFQPIFLEFLRRLTDRVVEVRMSVLEHVKLCMLSNPFRPESPQLIAALCDRLLDYDENIRQKVVAVVSDITCHELSSIPSKTIKLVAERLRDKSLPVKKYTMERLSDIYRTWCLKHTVSDDYDWIPGRILRCFFDKDLRSDTVEYILCVSLFPPEFSVRDKVKTWVKLISKFDKVEVKALEKILEQKQRLQLELQKYLSLRQMYKDGGGLELQKKVALLFRFMSHCFTDPIKAETDFMLLHQLKDANIWKIFTTLLDPNTNSLQTWKSREELLKIVGQKHPLYGILSSLSMKCSYILFNKDYVKDIFLEVDLHKSSGNKLLAQSCMNLLVILASFRPSLLSGTEKDLIHLLEDDNEAVKEGVLHVLAKAGGAIRDKLGESSSTIDLILERICVEGSRRQAKYAVHALAAITKDDGLKSLSVLYKRLVDMLEKKTHLPSVLQSLGCIAQTAMPVFETQESRIQGFIKKDILQCSEKTKDETNESWNHRSELCSWKIFGIKTLVKSYLPVKDAHLRVGISGLIKDLQNILSIGEISKDIESSCVDKAHLKLASAKAILRLSKHWDKKIPIDVFYLTLTTSQAGFPQVRKLFLMKVHQYIKDRILDPKFACAFLLNLGSQEHKSEDNDNLSDIIQMCQQGKARQVSVQNDGNSSVVHTTGYILPFLIHALAHHPLFPNLDECKDLKAYEPIYRKLYLFLSMLALGDEEGKPGKSMKKEEVIIVISILQSIRSSEDAVDTKMSKNSYAICDLCFSIIKILAQNQEDLQGPFPHVPLLQFLYKPREKKQEKEKKEDQKEEKENEKEKKEENDKEKEKKEEKEKENEKKEEKEKEEVQNDVTEGHTWLSDASVLAHFESLNMEANDSVDSKIMDDDNDDILKDIEEDGKEVPLGTMLKRLKAKGAKEKKESETVAAENNNNNNNDNDNDNNNNVDVLGMVKEINLDNPNEKTKFGDEIIKVDEKQKRKRLKPHESVNVFVPKRQKSSSKGLSAFDNIKMSDDENHNILKNKDSFEDRIESTEIDKSHVQIQEHGNIDESDPEKPKKTTEMDGNNQKSNSVKKRKRKSIAGLAKCTSKEKEIHTTDLIGKRIEVWWPMDKAFYEGLVKSYDHQKKKHVVLYNDGEVEVLRLDKEKWKLLETSKPTKRNKLSKSSNPKRGFSKKKIKVPDNSKKFKDLADMDDRSPSSMVRGKRTPRKNRKRSLKGVFQRFPKSFKLETKDDHDHDHDDGDDDDDDHEHATFSKVDNLDTEEEASDREEDEEKQSPTSPMENSGLRSNEEEDDGGSQPEDDRKSLDSGDAEFSDDVPLGVWKSKVRKADESKEV
ncbi:hypothetical protein L2E82_31347 [Cichorium intybus]|uniref:Uncharacterized protein n=1 Tax=Cichorium intybus TaxID=13427 RepID=A0ACB9D2P4_CICIN|nr:hypothetical protein L2E82_31347 [Cichorium intybus]